MKNIEEALEVMNRITEDACNGKLSEAECKKRFDAFRAKYGDDLIYENSLGNLKNEPASKEKLRKLRNIQAQGGTSEETFLEMARTGRKLRQKKITYVVATVAAVVAVIAVVTAVVSILKNCSQG